MNSRRQIPGTGPYRSRGVPPDGESSAIPALRRIAVTDGGEIVEAAEALAASFDLHHGAGLEIAPADRHAFSSNVGERHFPQPSAGDLIGFSLADGAVH